jgi:hypothetical protein
VQVFDKFPAAVSRTMVCFVGGVFSDDSTTHALAFFLLARRL